MSRKIGHGRERTHLEPVALGHDAAELLPERREIDQAVGSKHVEL